MSAIHIDRHDEAAENRSKPASDAESTGAKLTDKRWKNGRSSCNGGVFRAVYYTDALTRLDVVGQTGNFICKAGLFVTVTVEVPRCFSNFTAMAILENSSDPIAYMLAHGDWQFLENALLMSKGRQFEYSTLLNLVVSLNVSDNNFLGKILEELTSLV
ncbi:hypothetical protein FEM48_Zijuj04G0136000 [Ziziphus jujuba var. spinosa]|uniref:Uncharacterized protein n=1 Tax=Ziziphus jujuba var. spinosa TaxID=714518 RepID=A0A978VK67_ZIZJJ|nr:hypothetical protein FEM48_Zijuj04G0136000 [Ziziphus jujuba var. spinosa]